MCSGPESSKSKSESSQSGEDRNNSNSENMNQLTIETEDSFSSLLELAANNDVEGFIQSINKDSSAIDEVGLWYVRKKGSKQIANEYRTPLMVAATYGSIDVLKIILSHPDVDVNRSAGKDNCTALHSAAAGGSVNAVETVKLLLSLGADPNIEDANGQRAVDLIVTPPKLTSIKASLEELLTNPESKLCVSITDSTCSSPTLSSSPVSPVSPSDLISSPMMKKEYPIDPSLPDIKNSIYSTDEFRMFSFKIRPCSRAYSHDWTECPFVHPGENARRRDPRKFHYSCVPCPDFRKGACRRGDMCEYAHGVFECWLHPAQYRTRLCKDGIGCARRVCFFAHKTDELRPLFVSTGSAVMSPRSPRSAAMDMAAALALLPGSPGQQMSPSSSPMGWPQPNVPTLHLPVSNLQQSSRLRSSLSARDLPPDDFADLTGFSQFRQNSVGRSGRSQNLTPSNLDDLFSSEIATSGVFSPSQKSALLSQFQQQQSVLSPVNSIDHPLYQASYGGSSPRGIMSPRSIDPHSPMGSSRLSAFNQREMQLRSLSSRDLGSNYCNSPVVGSPVDSWSKWSTPNGKVDWSVNGEERVQLQKSCSFGLNRNGEEPDLSWVQSLVKESPPEMKEKVSAGQDSGVPSGENMKPNSQIEPIDNSVLGAWLEQMQLDQLVA